MHKVVEYTQLDVLNKFREVFGTSTALSISNALMEIHERRKVSLTELYVHILCKRFESGDYLKFFSPDEIKILEQNNVLLLLEGFSKIKL